MHGNRRAYRLTGLTGLLTGLLPLPPRPCKGLSAGQTAVSPCDSWTGTCDLSPLGLLSRSCLSRCVVVPKRPQGSPSLPLTLSRRTLPPSVRCDASRPVLLHRSRVLCPYLLTDTVHPSRPVLLDSGGTWQSRRSYNGEVSEAAPPGRRSSAL